MQAEKTEKVEKGPFLSYRLRLIVTTPNGKVALLAAKKIEQQR